MDRLVIESSPGPRRALAMYTTVYPAALPYLADWSRSVRGQTDADFTLWLGLDGVSREDVEAVTGKWTNAVWVESPRGVTPAQVRDLAIRRVALESDAVVFVDSDDVLLPSRVASARAAVASDGLVACALRMVDAGGRDLGKLFGPERRVAWPDLLPHYNVFGLSNTVYRSSLLRELLPVPADCIAVDWLLATRAWSMGAALRFDDSPHMQYRQHGGNTARLLPPFDEQDVRRATEVVGQHYHSALGSSWEWSGDCRRLLEAARSRFDQFRRFVSGPGVAHYVSELNRISVPVLWWSCVANADLEWQWKN